MCGGPEHSKPISSLRSCRMTLADDRAPRSDYKSHISWLEALKGTQPVAADAAEAVISAATKQVVSMLEFAAENDLEAFRRAVENEGLHLDEEESWYVRRTGIGKMSWEKRTPLMIAALYGSVEVLAYILNFGGVDVNRVAGEDRATALHCAAAGGSSRAPEVVELLLSSGADRNASDAHGHRPIDILQSPPKVHRVRSVLRSMLSVEQETTSEKNGAEPKELFVEARDAFISMSSISSACSSPDSFSPALSPQSPSSPKYAEVSSDGSEKTKEVAADPSLPDIKNSIYTTDEFRMFSFKIRPCSRAYSHDWTECPFVHPGENARRRDPRKYHYSCVPCPDFRKGACRRGDTCEYAHGVFECWLHPAQYRTRLCKEGTSCGRRVCFFAHTSDELRPLIVSSGSSMPSPRASSPLDVRSMSPPLSGASQSPVLKMPPFSPSNASGSGLSTPPLSPSASSIGGSWSQQANVPALILPGSAGLHASRLRAALNARDIQLDEYVRNSDLESQLAVEFASLAAGRQQNSAAVLMGSASSSSGARIPKFASLGLNIPPTNLQDLFSSEISPMQDHSSIPSQLQSQLQLQQLLSPLTSLQGHASPQMQSPGQSIFSGGSPRSSFSGRRGEVENLQQQSSLGSSLAQSDGLHARKAAAFAQRERGSWSLKEVVTPGSTSIPSPSWSDWGSPSGKPDWGVQGQDLGSKFRKSTSFGVEPDVSWVQSLVKDGPSEVTSSVAANNSNMSQADFQESDGFWD